MFENKILESKRNSTKWPRSVTNLKLSSLLCAVLFLALVKVGALAVMGFETAGSGLRDTPAASLAAAAGDNQAQAQTQTPAPAQAQTPTPAKTPPAAPAQAAPAQAPAQGQGEQPLNWQMLKQKQEELAAKEAALKTLETDLNARQQRLSSLEAQVKSLIDQANSLKDEKLKHLIAVYVNMKAKQAAQVLETLDEGTAVKILAGMNGRQAGEILTNVSPKKAARLTDDLTRMQLSPGM
jgi:flagellar motility protein MotE (MotC chaperone)